MGPFARIAEAVACTSGGNLAAWERITYYETVSVETWDAENKAKALHHAVALNGFRWRDLVAITRF